MESSRLRRRSNSTESCRFDARSVAFYPGALVVIDRSPADSSSNEDRRVETLSRLIAEGGRFIVDKTRQERLFGIL